MSKKRISILVILCMLVTLFLPMNAASSFAAEEQLILNVRADCIDTAHKRNYYSFDAVASHSGKIGAYPVEAGKSVNSADLQKHTKFTEIEKGKEISFYSTNSVTKGKKYDFYIFFTDGSGKEHGPFLLKNVEAKHFPKGTGSVGDPYQIWTPRQLYNLRTLDGVKENNNVKIMQNIDAKDYDVKGSVTGSDTGFYGTIDGNKKVISGLRGMVVYELKAGGIIHDLHITKTYINEAGIFTKLNGGSVKSCSVADVSINGSFTHSNGIFAGQNSKTGVIKDCVANLKSYVKGADYTGSIVGDNFGRIETCASRADVTTTNTYAGGIAGLNRSGGAIIGCAFDGEMVMTSGAGGITGTNHGTLVGNVSGWSPNNPYDQKLGSVTAYYSNPDSMVNFGNVQLPLDPTTDENGRELSEKEQEEFMEQWLSRHGTYRSSEPWIQPIWYAVTWNFHSTVYLPAKLIHLALNMFVWDTVEYNDVRPFTEFTAAGGSGTEEPVEPDKPDIPTDMPVIKAQSLNSSICAEVQQFKTKNGDSGGIIPISIPQKGTFSIWLSSLTSANTVSFKLTDKAGGTIDSCSVSRGVKTWYVPVSAGGTYYMSVSNLVNSDISFTVSYAPAGGTTLTKGKAYSGSGAGDAYALYKITAPKTGYITLDLLNTSGSDTTTTVRLANSGKKYLTTAENFGGKTRFGVKAGTYYIAIKSNAELYQIKPTFTTVTESKAGTTRAKATVLKKGGTKKGIITASQSNNTGDWYKFTIKKSQKVYLDITTRLGKGQFRVSVYKKGTSTVYGRGTFDKTLQSGSVMPYKNKYTKKLPAGTYYIKVEKRNGSSGYYKLKWS